MTPSKFKFSMTSKDSSEQSNLSQQIVGMTLAERYEVVRLVGKGGMSWVFESMDTQTQQNVALKVLLPHLSEKVGPTLRFLREAHIQSSLQHESIVSLLATGQSKGLSFLVLEWIKGENLHRMLERISPPYNLLDIFRLMEPICSAVGFAHHQQMVHRDLKPENFLINWDQGRPIVKVSDFGVAKAIDLIEDSKTRSDMMLGTIPYMSPEQIQKASLADLRSDIYSLGVCLYHLAVGRLPFVGKPHSVLTRTMIELPLPPNQINPNIPRGLNNLILRCLEKEPKARFQTCNELLSGLKLLLPSEFEHKPSTDWPTELFPPKDSQDSKPSEHSIEPLTRTMAN